MTGTTPKYMRAYRARLRGLRTGTHPNRYAHLVESGMLLHRGGGVAGAVALCGYTWVPTGPDEHKPLCPACERISLQG